MTVADNVRPAKHLSANAVGGGNITMKTLGENSEGQKIYEIMSKEYEFKIKPMRSDFSLSMKALCVSRISELIGGKSISVTVDKNLFLKEIGLADNVVGSGQRNVLIGADLHWFLVNGIIRKKWWFGVGNYFFEIWLVSKWSSAEN